MRIINRYSYFFVILVFLLIILFNVTFFLDIFYNFILNHNRYYNSKILIYLVYLFILYSAIVFGTLLNGITMRGTILNGILMTKKELLFCGSLIFSLGLLYSYSAYNTFYQDMDRWFIGDYIFLLYYIIIPILGLLLIIKSFSPPRVISYIPIDRIR